MKRIFEFEFNDEDLGPTWFTKDHLDLLMYSKENTHPKLLKAREITNPTTKAAVKLLGKE